MSEHANKISVNLPLSLYLGEPHGCSYLPGRQATEIYSIVRDLSPADYEHLMNAGFRRSGRTVYRPVCQGCSECVPIRVPTAGFAPSRSQRRVLRRNHDVNTTIQSPQCTDEKAKIFSAYLEYQHDGSMTGDRDSLERFLYDSPTQTLELEFRIDRRLVAVSIVDEGPTSWSSVYAFFDPAELQRSLGVYSALCEIAQCSMRSLPYWYIGYYIRNCRRMNYKADYRPYELLGTDGVWRVADRA
jgi:arginine-tRNA-protein transferase